MKTDNLPKQDIQEILDTINALYELGEAQESQPDIPVETDYSAYTPEALEAQGYAELQIDEITRGIEQNLPVGYYAKECYNWRQMQELRLGLLAMLDVSKYDNPLFSAGQMREIRLGLEESLDVSSYAKLIHSTKDMETARKRLLSADYKEHPGGHAKSVVDEESGITIRISDDCMEAFITLPEGGDYTETQIRQALKRHQVIAGVSRRMLTQALKNAEGAGEIKVAEGKRASVGTDGRYEFYFNSLLPGEPRILKDGSVDYTAVLVADKRNAGDLLARYFPATPGTDGETVTGIPVKGECGVQLPQLKGQGFVYDPAGHEYRAAASGYVMLNEDEYTLNIRNVYVVDGDINRYNGQISYDGAVYIRGSVGDMAQIAASGNVVVDGFVEAAYIRSGENIILRGGMNGGGKGILEANGRVVGGFFEAVQIRAKGDIEGNYFMNCQIVTDGGVFAKGTKSKIVGGNIKAGCLVETFAVMTSGKALTVIDVGDPAWIGARMKQTQTELARVQNELRQLTDGKEKINSMLGGQSEQNALFHKTCVAIQMKEEEEEKLRLEEQYDAKVLRRAGTSYIKVYGQLQAGATLIVRGKIHKIVENKKGAVFSE